MLLRLSFLVLFFSGITATLVTFENGSYTDIIVAFDGGRTRGDEDELVKNFTNLIKDASRVLYVATQGLAYFKQVRIILTTSDWFRKYYPDKIAWRSTLFPRADIRIGSPNVEYGTPDAFTLQTGECGEPGKFILLSDSFVRDLSENTAELAAATCVNGIQGWAMTEYHERCVLDCGRVRSNCRFFPDPKSNSGVESSLMSYPHLRKVKRFCNSSTHNRKAPSMQNKMCNSKSIMEIIMEHEDFKDKQQRLDTRKEVPPEETNVIQVFEKILEILHIVFVVESSHWMDKENGTQEVQHFIERFFVHLAPRNAYADFIKFSNESEWLWGGIRVGYKSEWQEDSILNVSTHVGSPSATPDIQKALDKAYKYYGWLFPMIILISTGDGKFDENKQYKSWEENKERIPTIHSFIIGQRLNWQLDHMIQKHGGDSYFMGDAGSRERRGEPHSFNMDMAFLASVHEVVDDHELPVVILYERFTVKRKWERYYYDFRVDGGIGKELVITFSPNYTRYRLLNPRLRSPPNKTHQYGYGSIAKSIFVDDAQPGRWTLELWQESKQKEVHVDVMITAKLRANCSLVESCVLVHAWITNVTEDEKGNGTKGCHRIYAEVKKAHHPVIDATVVATVQILDQQNPIKVTLRDNGAAPDVFKDDGIYSNFFPVTERQAGRPIVIVRVSNEDGKAGVKIADSTKGRSTFGILDDVEYQKTVKKFGHSKIRFSKNDFRTYARSSSYCKQRKEEERVCAVPLPLPFTRCVMANSPILFPMSEDEVLKTPPAAIWDLKVVHELMRWGDFFVLLQWTSPEHPRPSTKVETIEVHCSRNHDSITLKGISSKDIIYIVDDIVPAGEVQLLEVKIPRSKVKDSAGKIRNVYLALRARAERGNAGEISNIAEAFFERPDVEGVEGKGEAAKGKAWSRSWVPWTVGTVVVIVAAVIGAVGYLMWKKNKGMMPNATVIFQQKEENE